MIDSRVPFRRERIDTTPYATSGRIAAIARISANRVAMCRILNPISSVSAGLPAIGNRPPEPQRAQDVAARLDRKLESRAHGPRPLAPGQKGCRRILDDGALKRGHATFVCRIVGRMANGIESRVNRWAAEMPPVVRASGMPEQIRLKEVRSGACVPDGHVEIGCLYSLIKLVQGREFQFQIDPDRLQLALHLECQPFHRCISKETRQLASGFQRPRLVVKARKLCAVCRV